MAETCFSDDEAFQVADALIEKPLAWCEAGPALSDLPVLNFVKFRVFHRAVKQYLSIILLLRAGRWEDALVLARSLYELNMNLSEINCSSDPEQAAKKFVRFGKFQLLRLEQQRLEDQLRDEGLQAQPSALAIDECEQKLAAIASTLDCDFAEFRNPKKKWQESWSGASVETLAQRLATNTGRQRGQSDYFVFRLGSLFSHNTPGSLFLVLPLDRDTPDWNEFCAVLDKAGRDGSRQFLHEASMCFVDIVGMAGGSIVGYERQWLDGFALPLLEKI
jgi:hypothetical protein